MNNFKGKKKTKKKKLKAHKKSHLIIEFSDANYNYWEKYDFKGVQKDKSKFFREGLAPLVDHYVDFTCNKWKATPFMMENKFYMRVILKDITIVAYQPMNTDSTLVELPIKINHIWAILDGNFFKRNDIPKQSKLVLRGYVHKYKYTYMDNMNIGIDIIAGKICDEDELKHVEELMIEFNNSISKEL